MTLYIPKKPFMLLGKILGFCLIFSWIPLFGKGIYDFMIYRIPEGVGFFACGMVIFVIWTLWFDGYNEEHKLIRWANEKGVTN